MIPEFARTRATMSFALEWLALAKNVGAAYMIEKSMEQSEVDDEIAEFALGALRCAQYLKQFVRSLYCGYDIANGAKSDCHVESYWNERGGSGDLSATWEAGY
jgi:hypothetical protein